MFKKKQATRTNQFKQPGWVITTSANKSRPVHSSAEAGNGSYVRTLWGPGIARLRLYANMCRTHTVAFALLRNSHMDGNILSGLPNFSGSHLSNWMLFELSGKLFLFAPGIHGESRKSLTSAPCKSSRVSDSLQWLNPALLDHPYHAVTGWHSTVQLRFLWNYVGVTWTNWSEFMPIVSALLKASPPPPPQCVFPFDVTDFLTRTFYFQLLRLLLITKGGGGALAQLAPLVYLENTWSLLTQMSLIREALRAAVKLHAQRIFKPRSKHVQSRHHGLFYSKGIGNGALMSWKQFSSLRL